NTGAGGGLDPNLPVSLVYAIAQPVMAIRRNALVISAGPIGGGGLNVYGALNCGKIYSIFLPMPGRNWSLQFCDRSASGTHVVSEAPTAAIRLEKPLVPPDVDLHYRFDFRRLPVPATESYHPIILKGVIAADGTVQQLVVYRGVLPELDEAARIAFSRWRFKPAMRDGKPVAVDILVGIPPLTGEDHVNR
ncbi:MAG: energy transducer TonB, partial [Candidatus Acidiferrales bacterium]